MSTRYDKKKYERFCKALAAQLKDEGSAHIDYAESANEAMELNHPSKEMIATIYEMLAVQEASHGNALRKIQKEICQI